MTVLNIGSLNIDHTYSVSEIVHPGETISAPSVRISCGGKGLNQSIALARAGCTVFHGGCVGCDGIMLRELLDHNGVDTSHLLTVQNSNGHAIIQVNSSGQNAIIVHAGSNAMLTKEQIDTMLEALPRDTLVLIQNETNEINYIARRCSALGLRLAVNPSPISQTLLDTFPFDAVDLLLINETEGTALTGKTIPEEIAQTLLKQYHKMQVVLTLGGQGVLYASQNTICRCNAFSVDAKDTTGAGDTFTGFFISQLLQNEPISRALQVACAAAALSVTKEGAADSIPTIAKVRSFLTERGL